MDGPWFRRNLRYLLIDLLTAAAFTTVFLVSATKWGGTQPAPHQRVDAFAYGLLIGIAAVLLIRRWAPRPALVVEAALVGIFLGVGYPEGPYFVAMAIVGLTVGRTSGRREATWAAVCATCLVAAGNVASFDRGHAGGGWDLFAGFAASLLVGTAPVVVGALIQEHRSWRVTAEGEAQARLIDAERLRMAREVHDVVGHSLSIISLQAGVALHVLDRRPEQAQLSLEAIRRTSIEALDELRATLALTRAGQFAAVPPVSKSNTDVPPAGELAAGASAGGEPVASAPVADEPAAGSASPDAAGLASAGGIADAATAASKAGWHLDRAVPPGPRPPAVAPGAPSAERAPLTGLGRLPGLLAEVRLCGVLVDAATSGPLDRLPADVDLAAYRIVQESLTNVLRHARGARVAIQVCAEDALVTIDVTNLPERPPADTAPVGPTHSASPNHSASPTPYGHGLTGLRERAVELGGELAAGPHGAGGWQVSARLPLRRGGAGGRTGTMSQAGNYGRTAAGGGGSR
ncbi:sensor histidine kinase [Frankia sp. AgB1.9]|uniref:sensor histidine kinase n=1 Tax=unclassified Frankia TaxID=2632575 RepID=UPI0019312A97|nr:MULTISPECIES: histidine kinase [unclassified Frankia]MBL7494520.1 sensor histidine kinase [Frankia sp. AgW1.1]MBL7553140.1 sensor histidine kinase [Frankia sp. AgB1.9]MBL7618150.1 sensor histidine kinase [Frankia sp. AgB1.8]